MFLKFTDDVDPKDRDPDEYIKRYGAEAYLKVEPVSAFSWRLASLVADGVEGLALCETMLPQILNESSRIVRSELMLNLSNASGIAIEVIKDEVDRLTDKDVANLSAQLIADLNRAKDSKRRAEVIRKAVGDLNEVVGKAEDVADFTWEESHKAFLASCEHNETANLGIGGWKTGWTKFDESFDGLPKEGQILGIAGAPNCGKSAWLTSLINNLLLNNDAGLSVIFHVLDDPRNVAYAKLLSALTAIPIGHIIRANKYISPYPDVLYSYNQAKNWLQEQMRTGRLVVKGQELGNDTEIAENLIDSVAAKTGNKIVYIGDSFHSLDDKSTTEERIRYKRVAEWTMRITETRRMTMVFTVELTKIGMDGRPRLYMLAESGKLMYAMKAVGLVYNELHDKRQQAGTYWVDGQDDGVVNQQIKRPILEIEWAKNKISEFKGSQYMRFHDHLALLEEMSKEEFAKAREESQRTLTEIPRQGGASMLTIDSMAPVRGNFVLAGKSNG
jgi:hypothetical protein